MSKRLIGQIRDRNGKAFNNSAALDIDPCYILVMPRVALSPIQRLREDLEDALVQADALDLPLVAIQIVEALEKLGSCSDGKAQPVG